MFASGFTRTGQLASFTLVLVSFTLISVLSSSTVSELAAEDGLIQNVGTLSFLIGSALFLVAYLRSSGYGLALGRLKTNRNLFYILLALALFFAFGEEISWGQRIIGWSTPEVLAEANEQGEMNLHNLSFFHVRDSEGSLKSGFVLLLSFNRLFTLFCLGFVVLLPLLSWAVLPFRSLNSRINLPVPALWLAPLLVLAFVATRVAVQLQSPGMGGDIHELKEAIYAYILALVAFTELRRLRAATAST